MAFGNPSKQLIEQAGKRAIEEYKAKLAESDVVQNILGSINNEVKNNPENSWISLAVDYYDHDPRIVTFATDGDGIMIRRVHFYSETETVPLTNGKQQGGLVEVQVNKYDIVSTLSYGLVTSGYQPIDKSRKLPTDLPDKHGEPYSLILKSTDIRNLVEEIVYDNLQLVLPNCNFVGKERRSLGSTRSGVGPQIADANYLSYYVPEREYKLWY